MRLGVEVPLRYQRGVKVYLDESLRRFDVVYPAWRVAIDSAVKLSIPDLKVLETLNSG